MPIVYEKLEIPDNYKCSRCAAHGVKLWRQYYTMTSHLTLLCCRCADPERATRMLPDGSSLSSGKYALVSDQIDDVVGKTGSLVPAVPTVDCLTYWGYTAVPVAGCAWWCALPRWPGDAGQPFHVDPADLAAEKKMQADRAAYSAQPEGYKRNTVFCVEATSHELHTLWRDFADDRTARECGPPTKNRVKWEQLNPGSMPTIGTDHKRPICVTCFWVRIDGQIVMFYEATSQLVDSKKIDAWLDKEYPGIGRCNAGNFHICLHAIEELNKRSAKTSKVPA